MRIVPTIVAVLLLLLTGSVTGQTPPPPLAKSTPVPKTELSAADFEKKIAQTLNRPQSWKPYEFPGFQIKVDLPREPVRQTESFYDDAVGNAKTEVHVAVGDDGTYLVGTIQIPYAITDEKLLREAYQEAIKEFAADPELKLDSPKDFYFNERLGLEVSSVVTDARYLPMRLRVFILGRSIYLLMAMPGVSPGEWDPPSKEQKTKISAEFDSFFASAKAAPVSAPATLATENVMTRGTFTDSVYRSEYFKFSITLPEGWSRVSADDVEGVRKWGLDYLKQNSDLPLSKPRPRNNLATFVSKPMGNDGVAMLAINLGLPADKPDAAMRMAQVTESVLAKVDVYKLKKSATRTKLATIPAVSLEGTMKVGEDIQKQKIYLIEQRGYLVAFTLTYHDDSDLQKVEAALQTLRVVDK